MERIVRMLLSLGAGGALANAKAAVDQRRREDWAVEGLLRRLDREVTAPAAASGAGSVELGSATSVAAS